MAGYAQLQLQARRVLPTAMAALFLGACSLAPEQLTLPGALTAAAPDKQQLVNANGRPGVPLSNPADPQTRTPRLYEGSGEYTGNVAGNGEAGGRSRGQVDPNGVTLNLVGASVPEVAKTVLGDMLHVNYSVSDKVKASITLSTAQPVPKDELLRIFEAVLRSEGIAISVENGIYHIIPADAAAASGKWAPARGRQQVGSGSTVVPLRYVAAAEMERVLKSVAPQTQIQRVDNARNLLIVSGSATELASVRDTVEAFDLDWMKGMSFALLPIESGDPEAIAKEMDTVFANDSDSPSKGIIRFVPNTRLKSVLVISSRPEYLRKAEGWLRRLDLAGQATEKQVNVYHVQNRPANELAVLLRRVYGSQQREQAGTDSSTQPQSQSSTLSSQGDTSGGDGLTPAPSAQSSGTGLAAAATATDQSAAGRRTGQGGGNAADSSTGEQGDGNRTGDRASGISIVSDEVNNSLIITATPREYKRMRQILSRIDIAGNQVLIEATIAEVTLNDELKFGLKWFFDRNGKSSASFGADAVADTLLGTVTPTFGGFSYFLNSSNVQVALNALNSVTTVNLVSSPSLMVLDNKKAVLQIGDEVPVPTQQSQATTAANAPIINSISYRNTGVILGITPRVGDNGRIQLDIEQEVSDVKQTSTTSTTDTTVSAPTIAQRRVKTSVAVGDGEAIMLGGLMRDQTTVNHSKVPLMGDIPVVGNLFKNKDDTIARTELFIAITPHVVRDARQIRGIADEFRDRLNLTTRPQRNGPPDKRENIDRTVVR